MGGYMIRYLTLLLCTAAWAALPVIPADQFDAQMYRYTTNGKPDVIQLGPGLHLTRGSAAWWLASGDSLVGAGMDKTIVRRMDPSARAVVNGWITEGNSRARVADLTLDANAGLSCDQAACGLIAWHWRDSLIERVKVVRLGSYFVSSESFGFCISSGTNNVLRSCWVEDNVGGYVSAFGFSGRNIIVTACTANFDWEPGWDTRLQAFLPSAGDSGYGENITISGCWTTGARFAIFNDMPGELRGLKILNNRFRMRHSKEAWAQYYRLVGGGTYPGIELKDNRVKGIP